jgi:hypothetical protein
MHVLLKFVEDDRSLEMAHDALLLGGLALLGLVLLVNRPAAMSGLWSSENTRAMIASTLVN